MSLPRQKPQTSFYWTALKRTISNRNQASYGEHSVKWCIGTIAHLNNYLSGHVAIRCSSRTWLKVTPLIKKFRATMSARVCDAIQNLKSTMGKAYYRRYYY